MLQKSGGTRSRALMAVLNATAATTLAEAGKVWRSGALTRGVDGYITEQNMASLDPKVLRCSMVHSFFCGSSKIGDLRNEDT